MLVPFCSTTDFFIWSYFPRLVFLSCKPTIASHVQSTRPLFLFSPTPFHRNWREPLVCVCVLPLPGGAQTHLDIVYTSSGPRKLRYEICSALRDFLFSASTRRSEIKETNENPPARCSLCNRQEERKSQKAQLMGSGRSEDTGFILLPYNLYSPPRLRFLF